MPAPQDNELIAQLIALVRDLTVPNASLADRVTECERRLDLYDSAWQQMEVDNEPA